MKQLAASGATFEKGSARCRSVDPGNRAIGEATSEVLWACKRNTGVMFEGKKPRRVNMEGMDRQRKRETWGSTESRLPIHRADTDEGTWDYSRGMKARRRRDRGSYHR